MKKSLSLLLAVVMVLSVFSSAIVTAGAVSASDNLTISKTDFINDEITYKVVVKGGTTKLAGAVIKVEFDNTALEVVSAGAAGKNDSDGEIIPNISGMYAADFDHAAANIYTLAYINTTGFTIGSDTEFFTITFRAISEDRPKASVEFKCVEFFTDDEVENDIDKIKDAPQTFFVESIFTLCRPQLIAVDSIDEELRVEWSECKGADYYNVYRKQANSSEWAKINSDYVYTTYFDDTTIQQGTVYSYLVTAVNEYGETALVGSGLEGLNFGAIASCTASAIGDGIKVEWSSLAGADSYDVLRKTVDETEWEKITTVTGTEYRDTSAASGVEYNYSIRAHQGKYTAGMSAEVPVIKYIGKPTIAVANIKEGLSLTITEVGGAEQYIVSKYVDGVSVGEFLTINASDFVSGSYTYTDRDVQGDKDYYYTAYAQAGSYVGYTTVCSVVKRLATPVLNSVENTVSGIKVSWNTVAGATKYNVYRKVDGAQDFTFYTATTNNYLEIKAVENGKIYAFTVAAQNDTGCSAFNEEGLSVKRISATTGVSAITTNTGIKVTWKPVEGAGSYTLYRKTATGAYQAIKEGLTAVTYLDTTAAANTQYYYTVKAKSGDYYGALSASEAQGMNFGTVTSLSINRVEKGVALTWNALSNAKGYRVYRKTVNDSSYTLIKTVENGSSYTDTTIPSGVVCQYKVEAYNGANIAEMTASVVSIKYLSVPVVSARNSADKVKVTITAVSGAEKYIIERAVGTSTVYTQIAVLTGGVVEYIDGNNIIEGEKYSYKVTAVSGDVKSFAGKASMTKLIAPKLTSCANVIAGITIKWTAIEDASTYIIYRKTPAATNWTQLAVTQKTEYVDASVIPNNIYQYTVEARTADGDTGYDSVGKECRFLETPDLSKITNSTNGVKFTWNKVAGATSYKVYRRTPSTSSWTYLGEVDATKNSYTNKEGTTSKLVKSGNYYLYTVRAVYKGTDSKGNAYTVNGGYDTTGFKIKYIATPKLKSVVNTGTGANEGIKFTWNKVNTGGTTWYKVYRKTSTASGWTYLGATKSTSWTDKKVKNYSGTTYKYTVRAACDSANSKELGSYNSSGLTIKRLANPTLKSATSAKAGITTKWSSVKGATGYCVYRKTANSGWKQIATVKGATKVSYLDKTAKKGTTYYYTVRAYSGSTKSYYNAGLKCKDKY